MKTIPGISISYLWILLLAACTPATPAITPEPPAEITPTPASGERPKAAPTFVFTQDDLNSFSAHTILLQQDYAPGFTRPELHFDYGRVPPLTLFADGTLVYVEEGATFDQQQVMQVTLSQAETIDLVQQVLEAGFERLESHTDHCKNLGDGTSLCVEDASTSILRLQLREGDLREVQIYAEFANDVEALDRINTLLSEYKHPQAQAYTPAGATLFLRVLDSAQGVTIQEWPLDRDWLSGLDFGECSLLAVPLKDDVLTQYLAAVSRNSGDAFFELEGQVYGAYLAPWLPGTDFSAEIQRQYPTVPAIPSLSLSRFSGCWIIEPPLPVTLRLVWIEAGDLWAWDWQEGEPYMLPAAGEVTGVRLATGAQTILFVQKVQSGSELWAVDADGSNPRVLASGEQLNGSLEMLSLSYDEQLLAFTHQLPQGGGELWAASLDGSGARRLVSHVDLMAIVAEPLVDFATPAGVTWMPDTHTLTYDAYPGFKNEGIYIYVQRQVMLVDADSGAQEVLLPFGEGGHVDYSPDGATMTIVTPERLRLMDLASRSVREAGFQYFAVGFGEYYVHPPMAWSDDSQILLVAQPAAEAYDQDASLTVWSQPRDGSEATQLAEFTGFFPSFAFSPDRTKMAYWRAVAPQSNTRQLHFAALDGSQHVVYDTGEVLEFLGWGPDSQTFVFTTGGWPGNARLANICADPVQMGLDFYPANLAWLNPIRFLFERREEGVFDFATVPQR